MTMDRKVSRRDAAAPGPERAALLPDPTSAFDISGLGSFWLIIGKLIAWNASHEPMDRI